MNFIQDLKNIEFFHANDCICMEKVNATRRGVGMLIGLRALKSLNSIKKIQQRMMVSTFNDNPSTKIISCYSPSNVSEETDLIAFYNELSWRWCNGYRRRKWTRRHEFKSWMRLIAFHIALIPLGKV